MIVLDVEASGLGPESYPIEIAWQHRYNPNLSDSFLIKPVESWDHWDQYAEEHIHHIAQGTLMRDGISVLNAARRMNDQLRDCEVYTDAVEYDRQWVRKLFRAAKIEMEFKMFSVYSLVEPSKVEAVRKKQSELPIVHRALPDVQQIIFVLNYFSF